MTVRKNTIIIKKYVDHIEEFVANAAITPGMLVELMSTNKVRAHATSGGGVLPMFALEDALQGKGIDDDYAATDPVQVWVPVPGEIVYALIADGQTIAIGDFLESNGAGRLTKHTDDSAHDTVYTTHVVAMALEAIVLDGSGSESSADGDLYPRIKVMVV
jgi:hypothetical protein